MNSVEMMRAQAESARANGLTMILAPDAVLEILDQLQKNDMELFRIKPGARVWVNVANQDAPLFRLGTVERQGLWPFSKFGFWMVHLDGAALPTTHHEDSITSEKPKEM